MFIIVQGLKSPLLITQGYAVQAAVVIAPVLVLARTRPLIVVVRPNP